MEQDVSTELLGGLKAAVMRPSATILQALETVDNGGLQIALCLDDQAKLRGIMTDGDLRRLIVSGHSLDTPVSRFLNADFIRVGPEVGRAETLDLMQSLRISHVPVIDGSGQLRGLHLLSELLAPQELPNEAVILAGGKGTRLWPLTENCPKPMLKVAGRPILERLVLHLAGHGVKKIYLAINYLGSVVEQHFKDGTQFGCEIEYLREKEPLGTAGPIKLLPRTPSHPLIVMNGDLVTQLDVLDLVKHHTHSRNDITIGARLYSHRVPFGCLKTEGERVSALAEKPLVTRLINAGVYIVSPPILELIPAGQSHMTHLVDEAIRAGLKVGAYELQDEWIDVGQKDQLSQARGGV